MSFDPPLALCLGLRLRKVLGFTQGHGLIKVRAYLLISDPVFSPLTQEAPLLLETGAEAANCHPKSTPLSSLATEHPFYSR